MNSSDIIWVKTIFIILNLTNLLIMWLIGNKLKKCRTDYAYWKMAIWIILSYSVVMGMRFGRMIDYNVYYERYVGIGRHFSEFDYEFTFKGICWVMYNLGIPYSGFIWFTSVLLIIAVLLLVKDYKKYAPFILILFLWEAHNAELFIRWYIAFSFFLMGAFFLKHRHFAFFALFIALASTTHIGFLLVSLVVFSLFFLKKQILPSYLVELLFLASLFLGSVRMLEFLNPYITLLGVDTRSAHYAESFEKLINGEYGIVGFTKARELTNYIRVIFAYSFPIFFVPLLIRKKLVSAHEANLFLLGTMLYPILSQVEILNRFGETLLFFSVIISSVSYKYILSHRNQFSQLTLSLAIFSLICNIWPVISIIINRNNWWEMLFIWNAEGRTTLPLQLFIDTYGK